MTGVAVDPSVATAPRSTRLLHAGITVALAGVGVVAVAAWLFVALTHLDDRYGVGHVQGAWIVLADYANDGVLYPPLFDGEHYGGTRWMPVPIALNAAAARFTGEYLLSGKAVGVGLTVGVLALVLLVLRRRGCPWPLAAALTGTIVATDAGRAVGSTLGGDVLPVVLQLGSLALFDRGQRTSRTVAAGVLAGLALASKLTGIWAALAVFTWLVAQRRWRTLGAFGAGFGASASVVLGVAYVASDGRFLETMLQLSFAGVGVTGGPLRPFNQLVYQLSEFAQVTWVLLPIAAAGLLLAGAWRRVSIEQLALGWALVLLLGIYTDVGTGFNQLLDVIVLSALAVGCLAARLIQDGHVRPATFAAMGLVVVWVGGSGIVTILVPEVREAATQAPDATPADAYPVAPLSGLVADGDSLLSEDPYVPFSLGRRPTVLDPFMLRRLDAVRPDAVDELITRIEGRAFDYVVLINPLVDPEEAWWTDFHFGPRVMKAIHQSYGDETFVDGYFVYRPKR